MSCGAKVQLSYAHDCAGSILSAMDSCASSLTHALSRLTACAWARRRPHRHCERRRRRPLRRAPPQAPSPARSQAPRRRMRSDQAPLPCCGTPSWCARSAAAGAPAGCALCPPSQGSAQGLLGQRSAAGVSQRRCTAQGLTPCGSGAGPRPWPPRRRCSAAQSRPASAGRPCAPSPSRPRLQHTTCPEIVCRARQLALSSPAAGRMSARSCLRGYACGGPAYPQCLLRWCPQRCLAVRRLPALLTPAHAQTLSGLGPKAHPPLCGRPASQASSLDVLGCTCCLPFPPPPPPRRSRGHAPARQQTRQASEAAPGAVWRQHPRERSQWQPWTLTLTLHQGLQPWPGPWPPRRAGAGAPACRPCPAAARRCSSRQTRSARARRSSWTPRRTLGSGRAPAARPRPPRPADPLGFRIMHRQRARAHLALQTHYSLNYAPAPRPRPPCPANPLEFELCTGSAPTPSSPCAPIALPDRTAACEDSAAVPMQGLFEGTTQNAALADASPAQAAYSAS